MKKVHFLWLFFCLSSATAATPHLNIYNWSGYLKKSTIEKFEKETNIAIKLNSFDTQEILEAKLLAGTSGYDLVFPTAHSFLNSLVQANVFQPLDQNQLSNVKNIDPEFMKRIAVHDPGNRYFLPYLWSVTGIAYDAEKLERVFPGLKPDSWSLLFDPVRISKLTPYGVSLLDDASEFVTHGLAYLKKDQGSNDPAEALDVFKQLRCIRPYVTKIETVQYPSDLVNGDLIAAMAILGDIVHMLASQDDKVRNRIKFFIPKEGGMQGIDLMGIPRDAKNVTEAHLFMNFLMRPEIIAEITSYTHYPNAIPASNPFIDPKLKTNSLIFYPKSSWNLLMNPMPKSQEFRKASVRQWVAFRAGLQLNK